MRDPIKYAEAQKRYNQKPETKAKRAEEQRRRLATPEGRAARAAWLAEYNKRPGAKEYAREAASKHRALSGVKEARAEQAREYRKTEEYRAIRAEYNQRPDVIERRRERDRLLYLTPEAALKRATAEFKARTQAAVRKFEARPESKLKRYLQRILRDYGLSETAFYDRVQEQRGLCANPGCAVRLDDKSRNTKLCVDHCHETSEVRRLLCPGCNVALGLLGENAARTKGLASLL
jgi:hypothetical protein